MGSLSVPANLVISGQVRPHSSGQKRWVRIQGLYESSAYEVPMDEHGEFRLETYLRGNYLLLVFEDGRLLQTVPLVFRIGRESPAPIIIELPESVPKAITVR